MTCTLGGLQATEHMPTTAEAEKLREERDEA